jgi:uncharacterized FlaG/YvyC family protein
MFLNINYMNGIATMNIQTRFTKLIISLVFVATIFISGCTSTPDTSQDVQDEDEETQRGVEGNSDSSSSDVARRESEDVDETQDQINEALTTLSETGTYTYHGGSNENEITLRIQVDENNIIQSAQIVNYQDLDSTSQNWVERYNQGIEAEVVGVSLEEAQSPEKVNGSSLTSVGFNEALNKLRQQQS